ncbi:uncharacterized protein N0V89_004564 [Didymosphaeria variabile]|uniref:RING-type domain-containing protein n=1 Tax=Didymosphaeria variabile TaxID=1932322 RepID=A0A9W9CDC0_9PLEO|nr:uncharacterized protein N0V89_004564 [Didymosphaeria variabile]KAJ4356530.1 hypothetical protein N0V89_004564 [Didymosphaeria variabile]
MATTATDPKLAPLADELKEFALTLDRGAFPKGFFCALCDQLAFDSYKLLCCNKVICSSCQSKLEFPTTCPSCDHSPVEADSCPPNKALRNTMRVWLQKQKKKEELKAASEVPPTPAVEPTPAPSEAQLPNDSSDKPVESIEEAPRTEHGGVDQSAADSVIEDRPASAAPQREEGFTTGPDEQQQEDVQDGKAAEDDNQSAEPAQDEDNGQIPSGPNGQVFPSNAMMNANGMPNQFGFGFNGQGNFGMGMNNMPNMMNPGWNNMGYGMNNMNGMNGMFGFGGNMGMGMNDMSMNYGGSFGNGWNGMGGGGYGFNGYNQMGGGYNQSGAYPEMMNQYPKNHMSNQNRFQGNGPGNISQQQNRNGSFGGGYGPGTGRQQNSRPGSRTGPNNVRRFSRSSLPKLPKASHPFHLSPKNTTTDNPGFEQPEGESRAGTVETTTEDQGKDEQASASAETAQEGKAETTAAEGDGKEQAAEGAATEDVPEAAEDANTAGPGADQSSALNQIQTVDSVEMEDQEFGSNMMGGNMQFAPQMMNSFNANQMNGAYNHGMGNMGYHNNNFGSRGGFNNAYGAATVLTGEPRGVGVAGAPTGPRAMREGRPNTGFSSRANNVRYNPPPVATPAAEAPAGSHSPPRRVRSRSPVRDESLRTRDRSRSRSRAESELKAAVQDEQRDRSLSAEPERRDDRARSRTPQAEDDDDYERRKEKRRHRSSRYDDHDERDERDNYDDRGRDDRESRGSRGDRTRSASADSKYRSRRDKDKSRSSRSHRDRSREHRRRHRSRSRSVTVGDTENHANDDSSSRRKDRSDRDKDRDKYRDRSRSRDRDRKDRKDRDYERDYDDEKYRSRDKDKDKERRRRRDREAEEDERDYDDDKHRSSRRSRKDRDRDRDRARDRDRDYEKESSTRAVSPPVNAPTGPSADNFSIRGASRPKTTISMGPPQPPTGPRALMPPKGPAADRDRDRRHSRKGSMSSSLPSTSTESAPQDHYAAEREKNARARDMLERNAPSDRPESRSLHSRISSSHQSSSRPALSSKRSRDDYDDDEREIRGSVPTGPASHSSKKKKSGDTGGADLASVLAKGLRKKAGAPRRGGVKNEGDVERELERVERERDGRRW